MKIGKLEKAVNKWQFCIEYRKSYEFFDKRIVRIAILKVKNFPEEGYQIGPENYKGIYFLKSFKHPLTILKRYLEFKGY